MQRQSLTFKRVSAADTGGVLAIEKSTAAIDEIVKVRYYPQNNEKVQEVFVNNGSYSRLTDNGTEEIEEDIIFANETEGRLNFPAGEIIQIKWIGSYKGGGRYKVQGNKIIMPSETTGVLRVKYKTAYIEWQVSATTEGTQLFVLTTDKGTKYGSITRADIRKEVILRVEDIYTGQALSNAAVYLDGIYKGLTDVNGYINLGKLSKGSYKLKVLKAGYKPNDADNIQNEVLVVE